MGAPSRVQFAMADAKLDTGGLYASDVWSNIISGGGATPAIANSARGGGLKAMKIGPQPTSGSPSSAFSIDLGADLDEVFVEFTIYLDFDATGDFTEFFRVRRTGGQTVMQLGQLDGPATGIKTNGTSWGANNLSTAIANKTATRVKVRIVGSSTVGTNDGTIEVYVHNGSAFALQGSMTFDDGKARFIDFYHRPTADILAEGGSIEFSKIAIDADGNDYEFSDLQQCAQLRGAANSETAGKWDQGVFVSYDPRVHGLPSVNLQAEVQASTDPTFATGVIHSSINLELVGSYVGETLTDNVDFGGVAVLKGLDPLATYHWRVRFVRDGTVADPMDPNPIGDGSELFVTDSDSFTTMSAPGGTKTTLKLMHGTCQRHDSLTTPHNHWLRGLEYGPHLVLVPDDHYYADLSCNDLPAADDLTAGATRKDGFLLHARGGVFLPQPWSRLAVKSAITGTRGNHVVESQFPGNATPTEQALVDDALPAFNRYWADGTLLNDRPEGRWGFIDTAAMRLFNVNACTYDNDGGSHGPEGRALLAGTPRLLGATQMAALLDAIANSTKPIFLIDNMPSFANDAASPSSAGVSWALVPDQRQAVIDAIEANPNIRLFMTFCGHWHFSCITRQGLPKDGKHQADVIAAPMGRPIGANFDTAFLAGYDGGFIFKSANGATVGGTDPTSMFALIDVDENAVEVRVRIMNGAGATLHDQTFESVALPPVSGSGRGRGRSRREMLHLMQE